MDHGQGTTAPAFPDAERQAHRIARDDMGDSYGAAYTTRSADEGYGERYSEAVKKVLDKKADKEEHMHEVQSGRTAERDQAADAEVHVEYDRTQGQPVAQKENHRHFTNENAV